MAGARIDDFADSVVADIDDAGFHDAGFHDVVLVGHSMAGVTLPAVASRLGSTRVRELVFAAALVPPDGQCVIDLVPDAIGWYGRRNKHKRPAGSLPAALAKFAFSNGMTPEQRRFTTARWYPKSASLPLEERGPQHHAARHPPHLAADAARPRAVGQGSARGIAAVGGVLTLIEVDTCHNLMISEPTRLAEIPVERCRRYGR